MDSLRGVPSNNSTQPSETGWLLKTLASGRDKASKCFIEMTIAAKEAKGEEQEDYVRIQQQGDDGTTSFEFTLPWKYICMFSSVAANMYAAGMIEKTSNTITLHTDRVTAEAFMYMCMHGYLPRTMFPPGIDALALWDLANMLDIQFIKDWITANCIRSDNILLVATLAHGKYDDLFEACAAAARELKPGGIVPLRRLKDVPVHVIEMMAKSFVAKDRTERSLWLEHGTMDFIVNWAKQNGGTQEVVEQAR